MSSTPDDAIGGYFALEPSNGNGLPLLKSAIAYQSARSAMAAALMHTQAANVWVPYFICGCVIEMLDKIGIRVIGYSLTKTLGVPHDLNLGPTDHLICVDYFGICAAQVDAAIQLYGVEKVLVDASQSLYFKAGANYAVAFSPRKFVGVPDGGLLLAPYTPSPPQSIDEADSNFRSRHLHTRALGQVAAGYLQYQEAENSLADSNPRAMSNMTKIQLGTIDFDSVASRRRTNYETLALAFSGQGLKTLPLPDCAVPLCFPVFDLNSEWLRKHLASMNIYVPMYWPDAVIPAYDSYGSMLRDRTLYLPCDQRYGNLEMQRIITAVLDQKDFL